MRFIRLTRKLSGSVSSRVAASNAGQKRASALLVAIVVLMLAFCVYALDRTRGSAYLWPPSWNPFDGHSRQLGTLGDSLPSFAHAFAFSVFSCLLIPARRLPCGLACFSWTLVDGLFEIFQLRSLAEPVAAYLQNLHLRLPIVDHVGPYLLHGSFDPWDLFASSLGALSAFFMLGAMGLAQASHVTDQLSHKSQRLVGGHHEF